MARRRHPASRQPETTIQAFHSEIFQGPLPPPSILVQYNDAVPDAAERILAMAEKQAEHRQGMEARVVASNTFNQTLGSVFAFILGLMAIVGGIYLIRSGKDGYGLASIITSLSVLGGIFFVSRSQQAKERAAKRAAIPNK